MHAAIWPLFHGLPSLAAVRFLAWHVAWISLIASAAFGIGAVLLRRVPTEGWQEKLAFSLGLGFSVLSMYVFALGLAHRLARASLLIGLVIGWICLALVISRAMAQRRAGGFHPRVAGAAVWIVAGLLALPLVLQPFYPPSDGDATAYHLAAPKEYLEQGKIVATPFLRYPVFPQFQEMLFTLALGVADDVTAHLISFVMWLATALALVSWGKREGAPHAGWIAGALWLGGPTGLLLGSNAYVDAGLALYAALAVVSWSNLTRDGHRGWAILSGLFAGCAAAIKYSGLFVVAALALATWLLSSRDRRGRLVLVFLAAAAIPCLPWYARNGILSGDPFFPFLGGIFPNRFWNADDLAFQVAELHSHSAGRSLYDFLRLWDRLAFNQGLFVGPEDVFSPAWWIPLPILLLARWKHPAERMLLLVALAYCTGWFVFCQAGRYLLPILPILCFGMARTLEVAVRALSRGSTSRATVLAATAAILFVLPAPWYAFKRTRAIGWPPVTANQREAFLARALPSYPAYVWLNRTEGNKAHVYAWQDGVMAYYADGEFMGDCFGPARFSQIESSLTDSERLHRTLQALGADYFLVPNTLGPVRIPADGPFDAYFFLAYSGPGARVYRLSTRPAPIDSHSLGQR